LQEIVFVIVVLLAVFICGSMRFDAAFSDLVRRCLADGTNSTATVNFLQISPTAKREEFQKCSKSVADKAIAILSAAFIARI
jgi:hypothetical protein